jgi:hypothetical protein
MVTVQKISVSLDAEDLGWARERAAQEGSTVSSLLTRLVRAERRREAHGRDALAEALKRYREQYPDDDPSFAEAMARVREWTNAEEPVRDPWER